MVVRLCRGKGRKAEATVEVETKEKVFAEVLGGFWGGSFTRGKSLRGFFGGGPKLGGCFVWNFYG